MTKPSKNNYKITAVSAALAGDSKKAGDIRVLDLCGRSTLADFVVLMTVESAPQLDAVEEEVSMRLKQEGVYCLHRDGMRSKNWKVLDYGGVIVHVFDVKAAEFYAIDKIYIDAKPVEWRTPAAPAVKKPAVKKAAVKKPAVKKAASGKAGVKRSAVKKPAAKKVPAKKPAAKKPPVKKASPKKAAAKKTKPGLKRPSKKK